MGLESVVNVSISRQTQGVSQAGFGTPMILGTAGNWPSNASLEKVRTYSSIAGVAVDYATSTDEYKMAAAILSQTPRPLKIKIAKRTADVAQVNTLTPDVSSQIVQHYIVTIDGVAFDFTSDSNPTAAEVVTGLSALINGASSCLMTASGSTTLILTAKNAGAGSSVSCSANLSNVATTPNNGPQEDLIAASNFDADWYCLLLAARTDSDILQASAWIESQRKIMLFVSNASAIKTSSSTDIAAVLKAKNLFRSAPMYSSVSAEQPASALAGRVLPLDPGSETWMFKVLSGVSAEALTESEKGFLDSKNVNYVFALGGINIVMNGKVAGGEYIDVIRGIDWLQARMQENIFGKLVALDKVPFTDSGIAIIESAMREKLDAAVRVGLLSSYTITMPKAKDVSAADKAARTLNGASFTGQLAGAVHAINISGVVTL